MIAGRDPSARQPQRDPSAGARSRRTKFRLSRHQSITAAFKPGAIGCGRDGQLLVRTLAKVLLDRRMGELPWPHSFALVG